MKNKGFAVKKRNSKNLQNKNGNMKKYYLIYTAVFAVTAVLVFSVFIANKKSFIQLGDGFDQHYRALIYYGQYLRQIVKNLLYNHKLVIPQWSFSLGLGNDVITTMSYYVLGDPLNLLSVFFRPQQTQYLYCALVIVRFYLSGIAFSYFFMNKNKGSDRYGVLVGALTYAFCGFAIHSAIKHPYFTNPMIYMPLILAGVDKIIDKKRPYLFIFCVTVSALSNIYFFYMLVLITVYYVLVRLAFTYKKDFKQMARPFLTVAVSSVVAVMIASVLFVPVIKVLLLDGRTDSQSNSFLLYPLGYYRNLLTSFFEIKFSNNYWCFLGFSAICLPSVVLLFMNKGKNKELKFFFITTTVFLFFPIMGKVLNGFSYVSNRWVFAYSLVMAYTAAVMWPYLVRMRKKQIIPVAAVCVSYAFLCVVFRIGMRSVGPSTKVGIVICFVVMFLMLLLPDKITVKQHKYVKSAIALLSVISIACSSYFYYSNSYSGYVKIFVSQKTLFQKATSSQDKAIIKAQSKDGYDGFSRYEYTGGKKNTQIYYDTNSTQYYWSLSNNAIYDLRKSMVLRENRPQMYQGFDTRTALLGLLNVRYYTSKTRSNAIAPYGFKEYLKDKKSGYTVYKNNNFIPFGYTYDTVMTEDYYDGLTPLQKQESLLQNALIENTVQTSLKTKTADFTSKKVDFRVEKLSKGVTAKENAFVVTKPNKSVYITVDDDQEGEYYVSARGFDYDCTYSYDLYTKDGDVDPEGLYTKEMFNKMPIKRKLFSFNKKLNNVDETDVKIEFKGIGSDGSLKKTLDYRTSGDQYFMGCHDYDINLGYYKSGLKTIKITFPEIGIYSFDDISVYCQPMKNYGSQVEALKEDTMTDVEFYDNGYKGKITLQKDKLLCMSVPYSDGWTAYVDGKEAEIIKTNKMFMGLMLNPGEHTIEFKYQTPFLKLGAAVSVVGIAALAVYVIYFEVITKKKRMDKTIGRKVDSENEN